MIESVVKFAKEELLRIEKKYSFKIVLAGFVGSSVNGLGTSTSDYDIRAIAVGDLTEDDFVFVSQKYDNYLFETKVFFWDKIAKDLDEWNSLSINYPSILSKEDNRLIHNDLNRSMIKLTFVSNIYCDEQFITMNKIYIKKGLNLFDAIDYEYSRAYMNARYDLEKKEVNVRKYLYTLLEIFSIKWMLRFKSIPAVFYDLKQHMSLSPQIDEQINLLLDVNKKAICKEKGFITKNLILNNYINDELESIRAILGELDCEDNNVLRCEYLKELY